jgi:SAM-dependent methyltransferase
MVITRHNRMPLRITRHALDQTLPPEGIVRVLDAGGGPGRYAVDLARRGYVMTLLDVSPGHVALARRRIAEAGADVSARVEAVLEGSFTDLSTLPEHAPGAGELEHRTAVRKVDAAVAR